MRFLIQDGVEEIEQLRQDPLLKDLATRVWTERLIAKKPTLQQVIEAYQQELETGYDDAGLRNEIRKLGGHVPSNRPYVDNVDSDNFQELVSNSKGLVVVEVWSSGCGACRLIKPHVNRLAAQYYPRVKFLSFKYDDSEKDEKFATTLFGTERIRNPTILFVIDGKLVDQFSGADSGKLRTKVKKYARQVEN